MEPTTNQLLCKDGYPAITRDGVVIEPSLEYWAVVDLDARDFSGLHRGKIPNKARAVSGQEIIECGQPWHYASTRKEANIAAVEKYLNQVERRIQANQRELNALEQTRLKARERLNVAYKTTP